MINKSDQYERKIFALGELLGLAGGFYGTFIGIGSVIFFIFSQRLFVGAILRKIYQIDTWQEREKLDINRRAENEQNQKLSNKKYREDGRKIHQPFTESEKFHWETFTDLKRLGKEAIVLHIFIHYLCI